MKINLLQRKYICQNQILKLPHNSKNILQFWDPSVFWYSAFHSRVALLKLVQGLLTTASNHHMWHVTEASFNIGCNCYTYVYYSLSSFSYATNECIIRWIARWVGLYRLNNTSEVSTLNGNKITLHLKCERKIQNKIDLITSISLSIQMPLLLSWTILI